MKVMCDDFTTIYVDGEEENVEGTGHWKKVATLDIPRSSTVVGIKCENKQGAYGIMVRITDEDGSVVAVSDSTWKCSNKNESGWYSVSFEEGTSWKPASFTHYQDLWKRGNFFVQNHYFKEKIIWTTSSSGDVDLTVFCRKVLSGDLNNICNSSNCETKVMIF